MCPDMMIQSDRTTGFRRNPDLEELLQEINGILAPAEREISRSFQMPKFPVVMVIGSPRSGTTLLMQWLAHSGYFGYPTNILSRFYQAPYIGALIQLLLTDPRYNYNDEILDFSSKRAYRSNLGKTRGSLEPNEFWYFWRRFIPNSEPRYLEKNELAQIDSAGFAAELAAMESIFKKPIALKGMILQFNIPFLSQILERVLFLFVRRHPFYNIQSLLEARERFFGDRAAWYSAKPREYDTLRQLDDPCAQVAGQVFFTNQAIENGLAQIAPYQSLTVSYEDFCKSPEPLFEQILAVFAQQGCEFGWRYHGPSRFESANQVRLSRDECARVLGAYKSFSGRDLEL